MNLLPVAVAICAGIVIGHASLPPADGICQAEMTAFPFGPGSKCCTHGSSPKTVAGGNSTVDIDQHPWAALIIYDLRKGGTKSLASGTLISARYVLTAAHTITGMVLFSGMPSKVRLGDYDVTHEGPDCVAVQEGSEDCTNGAISIEIERTIPHPEYNAQKQTNDIGLIRLKEAAPYTVFIRPICLPTTNLELNPPDHSLYAVGWSREKVKTLYEVPFVNQELCQPIYSTPSRNITLEPGHICAGGLEGKDPCKGDGGGPLVYENKEGLAELTGINSFGPFPCGQKDIPSVYTNVFKYLDWIKANIVA